MRFHDWGALGYELYFSALPWYCDLFYWDGVPYYYAGTCLEGRNYTVE
jgi:hypothetical protein